MSKKGNKDKEKKLPQHLEDIKTKVSVGPKAPTNVEGVYGAHAFASLGVSNELSLDDVAKNLRVKVVSSTPDALVFDLIGVEAPVANALRRIMIAEVPTMAIDKVKLFQNTSIIQDEVLCHRIGLIPIQVDPRQFDFVEGDNHNELNTTVFTLVAHCTRVDGVPDAAPPTEKFKDSLVYSSALKWVPQGRQKLKFAKNPIKPVHDDILLAKLRPGQSIEAELWVTKGIGRTHTKWSPVCTASYRLMPDIQITTKVVGEEAVELKKKCPMDVFDIEDSGQVVVARPRNCSMCRECIREPKWQDRVKVGRVKNHFIFSVESTGAYKPADVFREAVKILSTKSKTVLDHLNQA